MMQLIAVRPYDPRIRERVGNVLARLGFEDEPRDVIASGTPDDDVVRTLRTLAAPDLLLIPFHAHEDRAGFRSDGLTLVTRIRAAVPSVSAVPVLMPVSQVAQAGFQLRSAALDVAALGLVPVRESELEDTAALVARLKAAGVGGPPR